MLCLVRAHALASICTILRVLWKFLLAPILECYKVAFRSIATKKTNYHIRIFSPFSSIIELFSLSTQNFSKRHIWLCWKRSFILFSDNIWYKWYICKQLYITWLYSTTPTYLLYFVLVAFSNSAAATVGLLVSIVSYTIF